MLDYPDLYIYVRLHLVSSQNSKENKSVKPVHNLQGYCPPKVTNEVIVYRVMMYANALLIVQAMYSTSKGQSVYYSTRG